MSVIGVVGEFNPFHLGHYEHFRVSRGQREPSAPIVCVMSGDFVQRGAPAIYPKHVRAEAAVRSGADLVFELPLPWCMSSAEHFALGAVGLLDALGVVTDLSFGSEIGGIAPMTALAQAAADPDVIARIRERMAGGMNFAAAREQILSEVVGEEARLLEQPNNILAVEYLKALSVLHSDIRPMTTPRRETVHDGCSDGSFRSAGQLRGMLRAGEDIRAYLPASAADFPAWDLAVSHGAVTIESLELAVLSRLRLLSEADFCALPDATEGLGSRLYRAVRSEGSIESILTAVKTKRYPLARLRRMVLCAALGIRADTGGAVPPYARLLASTARGRELLHSMNKTSEIPIINKPAAVRNLGQDVQKIFTLTADARDFYVLGYRTPGERRGGSDWRTSPVTL